MKTSKKFPTNKLLPNNTSGEPGTPFGQFEPVTERISKNFLFGYKHAYFINRDNFN